MKTLRKILDRLLALLFATPCYSTELWPAPDLAPSHSEAPGFHWRGPERPNSPALRQRPEKYSKFPSSAALGAIPTAGCGSGGGFRHPSQPPTGIFAPMEEAIAPMRAPFAPMDKRSPLARPLSHLSGRPPDRSLERLSAGVPHCGTKEDERDESRLPCVPAWRGQGSSFNREEA